MVRSLATRNALEGGAEDSLARLGQKAGLDHQIQINGTDNGNNFPFGLRRLGHGYFPVGEFALNEAGGSLHRWLKASRVRAACSGVVVR